jgi:hypothetical protein
VTANDFHDPEVVRRIDEATLYKGEPVNIDLVPGPARFTIVATTFASAPSRSLTITGNDPLAVVEIADVAGTPLRNGEGHLLRSKRLGELKLDGSQSGILREFSTAWIPGTPYLTLVNN